MGDLNSLKSCAEGAVTPSGSPTTGSLAKFAGSNTIATGNLAGDVTTNGSLATSLASSGVTPGYYTCVNATFDAKGRATGAANGSCGGAGGATPSLVQSGGVIGSAGSQASFTVTLGSNPTAGNMLLAVLSGYSNSGFQCPTGFNNLYLSANAVANLGILVCARVVQSGDAKAVTGAATSPNGNTDFFVVEIAGAKGVLVNGSAAPFTSAGLSFFGMMTGGSSYTIGIAENDNTIVYSSISNASLLFDGTSANGNHPSVFFRVTALANININYTTQSGDTALLTFINVTG